MTHGSEANADGLARPSASAQGFPQRFGKYTLLRRLATGGMAEIFLALQRSVAGFEKLIVIKRILPSMSQDEAFRQMLTHEARIAATLSHPNIVQIFDLGFIDGSFFIAMEYAHGEDLRSIVRQMRKLGLTDFPLHHALAIVRGICSGLAYAHDKRGLDGEPLRIVHRDISPQNVIVTFEGDVKIVDFGIAKSGFQDETELGQLKGKVPYMSPEQARGEAIDLRSDVFSTGVVLFELTTGKRLFKGANELHTLQLICDKTYPHPSQVRANYPPRLDAIVMRALQKDRDRRYQSARDMLADLEDFIRDERIPVSTVDLNRWMQGLFSDRLALHKAALQDAKQLADIIAADSDLSHHGSLELVSRPDLSTFSSAPAAARSVPEIPAPPKRGRTVGLVAAIAAAALVVAGTSFWLVRRNSSSTSTATDSSANVLRSGVLSVQSTPPDAAVWINGELLGVRTPARIDKLPLGSAVTVKVTKEGFVAAQQEILLTDAQPEKSLQLDLPAASLTLVVNVNAPEPKFYLDDEPVDGPRIANVAPDRDHRLRVTAPGYVPGEVLVRGGANEIKDVSVTLTPEASAGKPKTGQPTAATASATATSTATATKGTGKLNVGSRGGFCNVSVGGRSYGPTPVGGIVLPAGPHRVQCKPDSGPARAIGVTIEPDQTARVSFDLSQ